MRLVRHVIEHKKLRFRRVRGPSGPIRNHCFLNVVVAGGHGLGVE
jgi:hypothetical protein